METQHAKTNGKPHTWALREKFILMTITFVKKEKKIASKNPNVTPQVARKTSTS